MVNRVYINDLSKLLPNKFISNDEIMHYQSFVNELDTCMYAGGEKLLLMVPESARFSYAYALLTVV